MIRSLCGCLQHDEDGKETKAEWEARVSAHHPYCCLERQRTGELDECLEGDNHNCPQLAERDYPFS